MIAALTRIRVERQRMPWVGDVRSAPSRSETHAPRHLPLPERHRFTEDPRFYIGRPKEGGGGKPVWTSPNNGHIAVCLIGLHEFVFLTHHTTREISDHMCTVVFCRRSLSPELARISSCRAPEFVDNVVGELRGGFCAGNRLSERLSSQTVFNTLGTRRTTVTGAVLTSEMLTGISWILTPSRHASSTISVWKISSVVSAFRHSFFAQPVSILFKPCVSVPG